MKEKVGAFVMGFALFTAGLAVGNRQFWEREYESKAREVMNVEWQIEQLRQINNRLEAAEQRIRLYNKTSPPKFFDNALQPELQRLL